MTACCIAPKQIMIAIAPIFIQMLFLTELTKAANLGDIRNCPTTQLADSSKPLMRMDIMPGFGFDALRSLDVGQVYSYNYSSCQISSNGLYLLPDNIRLIPILNSQVDFTADIYDHIDNYTSQVAQSLNVRAKVSFAHINAKFSLDYQKTKKRMVNDKSRATRVGLRYHLYSVEINPDAQLNPLFKARILDIAANIQNKNNKIAHYLAELLIRDYGTHVVTSIDAGARLSQTTFFHSNTKSFSQQNRLGISASASANFFHIFSIKMKYSINTTKQDTETFQNATRSSYTTTHGGPMYILGDNFTYADWEKQIPEYLVAIDRRGEPISSVLTHATMPELPSTTLVEVSEYLHKAISRYYAINTHSGCTDYNSENFNFHANVDDGKCINEKKNHSFGGIFQKCTNHAENILNVLLDDPVDVCSSFKASQKNPLTGDYNCPADYQEVLLHSGILKKTSTLSNKHCWHSWFKKKCSTSSRDVVNTATYEAYWCTPSVKVPSTGLYFGGFYTLTQTNILTNQKTCPQFYFPLHFGEDMQVCVANDVQAQANSLEFGGFFSCTAGNPLAASDTSSSPNIYPKHCPIHYNQIMVTVDEDCIVNVCVDIKQTLDYEPQPPILPPFRHNFHLFANDSNVLVLTDSSGETWVKEANGEWTKAVAETEITTGQQLLAMVTSMSLVNVSTSNDSEDGSDGSSREGHQQRSTISLNDSELAGIILGTIVGTASIVVFLWIAVGFGVRKYRKPKRMPSLYDTETHIPIINQVQN